MIVGKLHEPVASEAMSQPRCSMPPRSEPLPERPPVENCTIMPGQAFRKPASKRRKALRIRGWRLVVFAHMDMGDGGARFKGGAGGLHLFADGDRNRRIMLLARHRPGDRNRNDARRRHLHCNGTQRPFLSGAMPLGQRFLLILQIQEVVVEVDFRQAQLRFAIIILRLKFRLLFD